MNMRTRARISGFVQAIEWTTEMEAYRTILERENHYALPSDMLLKFIMTFRERDKFTIAQQLDFSFARRGVRKWPELLFLKMLRTYIQQANKDLSMKHRLLLIIIKYVPSLQEDAFTPISELMKQREAYISKNGFWCFYWTMYLHPDKIEEPHFWEKSIERLIASNHEPLSTDTATDSTDVTPTEPIDPSDDYQKKLEKKLQKIETKYAKESAARQQMENELVQSHKQIRMKEQELERISTLLQQNKQAAASTESKLHQHIHQLELQEEHMRKDQNEWLEERRQLLKNRNEWAMRLNALDKKLALQAKEAAACEQKHLQTIHELKQKKHDPAELIWQLIGLLYKDIQEWNQHLLQHNATRTPPQTDTITIRENMQQALNLANVLEEYYKPAEAPHSQPPVETRSEVATQTSLHGTFYRRDHGGYIQLENNDIFNITESLVYQHNLQHEAEVLCTPSNNAQKPTYYELELLFQGDDSYSPILQFDGFVENETEHEWFCVDMNDGNNRFPIHYKDIEIQKPTHGDPCTFNVAEEGSIARITKLYRIPIQSTEVSSTESIHPAILDPSRRRNTKNKAFNHETLQQEPFLTGCTITIIGGVRKWFEEVVLKSGAKLVHENGDHPDRVAADLSRSQALFLLLTATSHRATWESIEIAKSQAIPHFVIQGSKSNLRMQLWDNRELIKQANR